MDQIPTFSRDIMASFQPTFSLFGPLLEAKREEITAIRKETIKYGSHERQMLDLYIPPGEKDKKGKAVMLFAYGGGFKTGDKTIPFQPLAYANLGAFFARRDIILAVVDYRLLPEARYPSGGEDVATAASWAIQNIEQYGGDPKRISLFGNSAGGVHVSHCLLNEDLFQPISSSIRLVCFLSVLFNSIPLPDFPDVLREYFGSDEEAARSTPQAILERMDSSDVKKLPLIVNILGTLEPEGDFATKTQTDFLDLAKKKGAHIKELTAEGHNHLSPVLALSTGQGEEWAEQLAEIVLAQ